MPFYNVPIINGNRYQWASITFSPAGIPIVGCKSIDYSQEKAGGQVFGTGVVLNAETRGQLKASGSFELYKEESSAFIQALTALGVVFGQGFLDVRFPIMVSYEEIQNGLPNIVTDVIVGARLKKPADSHSEGTDALTTKFDFSCFWITPDGNPPVIEAVSPL